MTAYIPDKRLLCKGCPGLKGDIAYSDCPKNVPLFENFPRGLGSLITYSLCVSIVFPAGGVYLGTVISLAAAGVYLLVYRLVAVRIR
jgi:hypothetical protein